MIIMKCKSLKIKIILTFFLFVFFNFYLETLNFGLPYFINADETAGIKSLLYFYGFFSHANQNVVEPIYFPLISFLSTGFLILIKNIFVWQYTLAELKDFFYLNPHLLYKFGRISSLIFCTLSLILYFLITYKLKISKIYILVSFFALCTSYLFFDIANVHGKNALLLFLFLLQYYFFIKYFIKIEKFNLNSYIIFSLLASLAWGINYWAATPSIYAILFLHFEKFKKTKINYILIFLTIFLILGFLLNIVISQDKIIHYFFTNNFQDAYGESGRFKIFLEDLINGFKIILNIEKPLLFIAMLLILISNFFNQPINKKFLSFNLILIFEPILLFAVADTATPQLRYFGPSIFLLYILSGFIIKSAISKNFKINNFILSIVCLPLLFFIFEKISILHYSKKILDKGHAQYKTLDDYNSSTKTLFFTSYMTYRENIETLNLYKLLIFKKLISQNLAADNKNTISEIEKKIKYISTTKKHNMGPSSKNNIFIGGEFIIEDHKVFFDYIKKKFNYVAINYNKNSKIYDYLSKNFKVEKIYNTNNLLTARSVSNILENNFNLEAIKKIDNIGFSMIVYKIN